MSGRVAAVVLAAGASSRLGRPKQTLPLAGRPVLQHVLDAAAAAGLEEIVVVLGHAAPEVAAALNLPAGARVVEAPDHASGQSASLREGLRALGPHVGAAVVLLGDQPTVASEAIRVVVQTHRRTGAPIVRTRYEGRWGHPVLLERSVWDEIESVRGDRGARDLLSSERVEAADLRGAPPPDLDTWEDYERLRTLVEDRGATPPRRPS